jgi:hypothetical protein
LLNYIIPKCIIKYIKFFVNFVNKSIFNLKWLSWKILL